MNAAGDVETTRNVDAGARLQALFAQVDNTSTKLYLPRSASRCRSKRGSWSR